jgi:hypothetical protein
MRYRENARDPPTVRFGEHKLHQLRASATPAKLRINRERADFRQFRTVVFEGHATHDTPFVFMHQEVAYILLNFIFSARQQQSLLGVPGDQFKNRTGV